LFLYEDQGAIANVDAKVKNMKRSATDMELYFAVIATWFADHQKNSKDFVDRLVKQYPDNKQVGGKYLRLSFANFNLALSFFSKCEIRFCMLSLLIISVLTSCLQQCLLNYALHTQKCKCSPTPD